MSIPRRGGGSQAVRSSARDRRLLPSQVGAFAPPPAFCPPFRGRHRGKEHPPDQVSGGLSFPFAHDSLAGRGGTTSQPSPLPYSANHYSKRTYTRNKGPAAGRPDGVARKNFRTSSAPQNLFRPRAYKSASRFGTRVRKPGRPPASKASAARGGAGERESGKQAEVAHVPSNVALAF
jgi:hypothetical protein